MVFVKMGGSPAVGPRVGLVTATDVLLFDGNPPGGACGRVSACMAVEALLQEIYPVLSKDPVLSAGLFGPGEHSKTQFSRGPTTPWTSHAPPKPRSLHPKFRSRPCPACPTWRDDTCCGSCPRTRWPTSSASRREWGGWPGTRSSSLRIRASASRWSLCRGARGGCWCRRVGRARGAREWR